MMTPELDTYQSPEHGWTCFHCGETFNGEAPARTHFGATPDHEAGCVLKLQAGDRGLLRQLRAAQAETERLRLDIEFETTSQEAFSGRLRCLFNSYAPFRGCSTLRDVFNIYDSTEGRAIAAEEKTDAANAELSALRADNAQLVQRCNNLSDDAEKELKEAHAEIAALRQRLVDELLAALQPFADIVLIRDGNPGGTDDTTVAIVPIDVRQILAARTAITRAGA